jgi:sialic acid synthase SpsE
MKRSLVVLNDKKIGDTLEIDDIGFKRPSNGLEPNMLYKVVGKKVIKGLKKDDPITFDSISW